MKNRPIVGKILTVLGVFGVFVIAVAFYTTSEMREITSGFVKVANTSVAAVQSAVIGNRALQEARAAMATLMIANTEAENQAALAELKQATALFDTQMASAATEAPDQGPALRALQARGDMLINTSCAPSVTLAAVATTSAQDQAAQAEFLNNCAPLFPQLTADVLSEGNVMKSDVQQSRAAI